MTKTSSLGTTMLLFTMTLLAGVFALTMLGNAGIAWPVASATVYQAANTVEWLRPDEVYVPSNLAVNAHAAKHNDQVLDAWKIYTLLLEGQCVASAIFCGPSDIERLYLCVDPAGRIGGLIVFGDEILTGYQANQDYWLRKVSTPEWEVCHD